MRGMTKKGYKKMITLITGLPGSGKSLFTVSKIIEILADKNSTGRKIYTNIEGINIDEVEEFDNDFDWTKTEDGSIIFYDEAQLFGSPSVFSSDYSGNDNKLKMLTKHRHSNHDIYFITQHPTLLNKWVLQLVNCHYHIVRFFGWGKCFIYKWGATRKDPTSDRSKECAEERRKFVYPKEVFRCYKSASAHTIKGYIPKTFQFAIFIFIAVCLAIVYSLTMGGASSYFKGFMGIASDEDIAKITHSDKFGKEKGKIDNLNLGQNVSSSSTSINNSLNKTSELKTEQKITIENKELEPFIVGCMIFDNKSFAYLNNGKKVKIKISDCQEQMQNMPVIFPKVVQNGIINNNIPSIPSNIIPVSLSDIPSSVSSNKYGNTRLIGNDYQGEGKKIPLQN